MIEDTSKLLAYFDDSGTHSTSEVVVWGGIVGTERQVRELEQNWRQLLRQPLPGKPPINAFHLTECRAKRGVFKGYSPAEVDRVQYLFRETFLQSKVMPVAFGVDYQAFETERHNNLTLALTTNEQLVFGSCVKASLEIAQTDLGRVEITFDQGRNSNEIRSMLSAALQSSGLPSANVICQFEAVLARPALQAADLVANYFYGYAKSRLFDPDYEPEPHFLSFLGKLEQSHWGLFGKKELKKMSERMKTSKPNSP